MVVSFYLQHCLGHANSIVLNSFTKQFCTSFINFKEVLKNSKKIKNPSSQKWLLRQINDTYVKKAKLEHYRCRSAFKLLEINQMYKLLKRGQIVVDLGCSPGSWTQVAVNSTQANIPSTNSLVIGVDLSPVYPIEGATLISALDFTKESSQLHILSLLGSRKVNVVLSDMAPAASGVKSLDHTNIIALCYAALRFAQKTSTKGSALVMKLFDGNETKKLKNDAQLLYERVHFVRPEASRKESSEMFLVCINFKETDQNDEYTSQVYQTAS